MFHPFATLVISKRALKSPNSYTVACESLETPCRICENVNNFNKIREIIQNACYFLFSTVLSKIFYIKYVYKTKNSWNYSNNPLQKIGNPWFLILCEVTWMIHDCSFVLCWLFMSPLFVLNSWTEHCSSDKSSTFCRFCSFPAFLHIWTLSSSDCMILRSIFSHWGQLRDSNTTIKKGSNIHWCSRRKHDALRAGCWKLLNRMKISNFFLLLKYIFFSIYYCPSEATEDTCMFPGRQIKYNLPWSSNSKSFHPPALNASCFLLEHQWMFEPF